ncbi:MAG: STAS domain-containing protein [Sedimentisphaerales bacterium]|nr:STAS domain-containing protein [Sedimentisphaerales bacterium]
MLIPKLITELKSYSKVKFLADLFAGLTVGVVALPLAMAFAIASGLPPERGIFTAIVAGFLISLLGGSKVQIGGPTGAFVILVSAITAKYGYEGLAVCTAIAGFLLILFGLCRMGGMIKFIPFPVVTGFTTGIALVIFSTQIRDLFGLSVENVPAEFIAKWRAYIMAFPSINIQASLLGIGTIVLIVLIRKYRPKLPAMLIGMLAATIISSILGLNVETIGSRFGDLPRTLPSPSFPTIPREHILELIKPAFTIALLAAIESLLSATVADGMISGRHRSNMELVAQGFANLGSVIFGGIPATGAIARTATNVKSGAKTPVAGIIHALTLALLLLFLAPYAKLIPLAALAGILVVVSYNMAELHHFKSLLKGPASDAFVLVLTFFLTILVDLTVAVEVGVVLAAMLFVRRMSEFSNVGAITRELRSDEDLAREVQTNGLKYVPAGIEVFEVSGPFFFGMIDTFKGALKNVQHDKVPVLIIRIRNVPVIDATGLHALRELHTRCKKEGTLLVFSGVGEQPYRVFKDTGFIKEVGPENVCSHIDLALKRAEEYIQSKAAIVS